MTEPPVRMTEILRSPIPVILGLGCALACGPPAEALKEGQTAFENYCAPCHFSDGRGVDGGGPPLDGSPWISGSEARLIRILLHGLRGPVQVGEQTYNREMLAFGPILSDGEIAAVLTFARRRFAKGAPPIRADAVRQVRDESGARTAYWTVEELRQLP